MLAFFFSVEFLAALLAFFSLIGIFSPYISFVLLAVAIYLIAKGFTFMILYKQPTKIFEVAFGSLLLLVSITALHPVLILVLILGFLVKALYYII